MNEVLPMQMVCEMARNLPCSPWLLPKLVKLLDSSTSNARDVEDLILKDPGLAAATLKMANSAYFAGAMQCESLNDAILRLGFAGLYRMATGSIATRWLSNAVTGGYGWEPGDLSKHSLCVAVASEILAKESKKIKPELAYTAGLLHDVGKLALAYACSDQFETIRQYQEQTGCSWRESEHTLLGYDHCDIGGALLQSWACPANLVQVACYYSRPALAGPESIDLVVHIHAAKHLAIQLGLGVGEEGFKTELDEKILLAHGYTEEMFMNKLPAILVETEKVIAGMSIPE
ncbi:MAG: HDOD domain-containing protein [Verrucomicrobiota bacterium]